MTRLQIDVDLQACASTGFCVRVAPDMFQLSETTGKAMVKSQPSTAVEKSQAEEAEITCPTGAVLLAPSQ